MQLLISDTNIFIDMDVAGLTELMFQLPETFAVPNILYAEELIEHHAELPGLGLQILEIQDEYMTMAYRFRGLYTRKGQNDLFALALAKQEDCPLLTGDSGLRQAAKNETVDVRGTLWLIERMFEEDLLSIEQVEHAYAQMKKENRFLPWGKVKTQITRLKKNQ